MKIYISNLGLQVTADSLEAVISTFGKISDFKLFYDQQGAVCKAALVEMANAEEASAAIARLDGSYINGRIITATTLPLAS